MLFALLLNVLTVGSVQIIVHQAQARWFEEQREVLQDTVQESFTELERVYNASAVDDAAALAVGRARGQRCCTYEVVGER